MNEFRGSRPPMERKLTGEEQLQKKDHEAFDPQEADDFEDRMGITTDALNAEREEAKALAMDSDEDAEPVKQIGMGKGSGRFEGPGVRGPKPDSQIRSTLWQRWKKASDAFFSGESDQKPGDLDQTIKDALAKKRK